MATGKFPPANAATTLIKVGGIWGGGNVCASWQRRGAARWSIVPDPLLPKLSRDILGPAFGEVTYDAQAHSCAGIIYSRHGQSRSFSAQAHTAEMARDALKREIANITFNPMWVEGFDTIFGPADDLSPATGKPMLHPYSCEWGDRLGTEIKLYHDLSYPRQWRPLDLSDRLGQLADVLNRGLIPTNTIEGARVWLLFAWGYGLVTGNLSHLLSPTSGLSRQARAGGLMGTAQFILAGALPMVPPTPRPLKPAALRKGPKGAASRKRAVAPRRRRRPVTTRRRSV